MAVDQSLSAFGDAFAKYADAVEMADITAFAPVQKQGAQEALRAVAANLRENAKTFIKP